jgi:hypothetical protein
MPAHRKALSQLLANTEQEIIILERRLLSTTDDAERAKLIDKLADLHIASESLKASLIGDIDRNSPPLLG